MTDIEEARKQVEKLRKASRDPERRSVDLLQFCAEHLENALDELEELQEDTEVYETVLERIKNDTRTIPHNASLDIRALEDYDD